MRWRKGQSTSGRSTVLTVVVACMLTLSFPAFGTGANHGSLVSAFPRTNTPQFLDGEVLAGVQIGNRIVVGGSFTRIEDATVGRIGQAYLAAYDVDTGRLDPNFRPALTGAVMSLADAGAGNVIAVGRFQSVNGETRRRVAKLRLLDGALDARFVANANGNVMDVAVSGDRAFLGGAFATVNGTSRSLLAAVSLFTGEVDAGFDIPVTGGTGYDGAFSVRGVDVSPDGKILASVHNDAFVDGLPRQGIALIDISGDEAEVLPWRTDLYDFDCQAWYPQYVRPLIRDVQFSPDGTWLVVATAIGNFAPGCDTVVRFPSAGGGQVEPDWISRVFDTPEALAVTETAIYVGGHMRWAMAPGTVWTDFPNGNTDVQPAGTVARDQIMALSPHDGTARNWDPGAGGYRGVLMLAATRAGLLVGSDGDRFGGLHLERHALFELARDPAPLGTRPDTEVVAPADGTVVGRPFPLRVIATDDNGVDDITIRIQNAGGRYLQLDGTFRVAAADLSPVVRGIGTATATTDAIFDLAPGSYTVTATAIDESGALDLSPAVAEFVVADGPGSVRPDGHIDDPTDRATVGSTVNLSGIAWDDTGIDKVRLIIQDRDTKEYVQADGSLGPKFHRKFVQLGDQRANATVFWAWTGELPEGRYRVRLHLRDDDRRLDPSKHRIRFDVTTGD